ncbi:hypothetical protein HDV01_001725 [Terramyces sp. JEL0728]|nr:hypothetical protein HDV01_001725 [Terramyces sp. JEL0728]
MVEKRPLEIVIETPDQPPRKRERIPPVQRQPIFNKEEGWVKTPTKYNSEAGRRMLLKMSGQEGKEYLQRLQEHKVPLIAVNEHLIGLGREKVQHMHEIAFTGKFAIQEDTATNSIPEKGFVNHYYPGNTRINPSHQSCTSWDKKTASTNRYSNFTQNDNLNMQRTSIRLPSIKGLLKHAESIPRPCRPTVDKLENPDSRLNIEDELDEDEQVNNDIIELDFQNENTVVSVNAPSSDEAECATIGERPTERKEKKVADMYEEWKANVIEFYIRSPLSLLTQAFKVELGKLSAGRYAFGDKTVGQSVLGSYNFPVVGEIISYGEDNLKTMILAEGKDAGKPLALEPGFTYDINELLIMEVTILNNLIVYDLTKEAYKKVIQQPPDLFYTYDPSLVFYGKLIAPKEILVNFFGQNQVFRVNDQNFPNLSLYYRDIVCRKQRVFRYRATQIFRKVDDYYVVDFNCSYAVNFHYPEKVEINDVERAIYGGVNYNYF